MKYHLKEIIPLHIQSREIVTNEEGFVTYDYDISKQKSEAFYLTICDMKKTILYECEEYPFNIINLESGRILFIERNFARVINLKNCKVESIIEVKSNEIIFRNVVFENTINYIQGFGENVVFDGESGFIDLFSKQIIWKNYTLRNPHIKEGYLFDYQDAYFARYSTETGELLWKIDVGSIFSSKREPRITPPNKVSQIIAIWQNYVLVMLEDYELLFVDLSSGKIDYQWFSDEEDYFGQLIYDTFRTDYVVGLHQGKYIEMYLPTRQVRVIDVKQEFQGYKADEWALWSTQQANYLMFRTPFKIGAFNQSTYKVEWLFDFEYFWQTNTEGIKSSYFPATSSIQIGGKYMYIYDANLMLYIFEKEEIE